MEILRPLDVEKVIPENIEKKKKSDEKSKIETIKLIEIRLSESIKKKIKIPLSNINRNVVRNIVKVYRKNGWSVKYSDE